MEDLGNLLEYLTNSNLEIDDIKPMLYYNLRFWVNILNTYPENYEIQIYCKEWAQIELFCKLIEDFSNVNYKKICVLNKSVLYSHNEVRIYLIISKQIVENYNIICKNKKISLRNRCNALVIDESYKETYTPEYIKRPVNKNPIDGVYYFNDSKLSLIEELHQDMIQRYGEKYSIDYE